MAGRFLELHGQILSRSGARGVCQQDRENPHPARLFKEAVHLNQQKDMLLELLADINPLNAKKRAAEIEALLEKYTPGVEKMRTRLKKYDAAYKELKAEIAALEKQVDTSKESVTRRLELLQQVQELEKLRKIVDNIPTEILALYSDANLSRKETLTHE